jgi:hypothetical protein
MNTEVKKRAKSLAWRTAGMIAVAVLGFMIDNATALHIPSYIIVFSGLLVGELTKYLNK